jgi:hypothetical protein
MKKACLALALAIALVAPTVAESAKPVRGPWGGKETKFWAGSKYQRYSLNLPVSFRLKRGKVVQFRTSGNYRWTGCTGGETVNAYLPVIRKAKLRHRRFRGKRTTHVGSRKLTTRVSGRFTSARSGRGKIVAKLAGCPTYRSVWTAERTNPQTGGGGGIHIPLCHGQQVTLPDGTYYYNPCAYVAGRPER